MAITPRGSTMHAHYLANASAAPAWPAGTVDGDVVYAVLNTGATATVTPPSGWTLVDSYNYSTGFGYIYRHTYSAASDTAASTWTSTGAFGIALISLGGVDTATPEDGTPAHSRALATSSQALPNLSFGHTGGFALYALCPISTAANTVSGTGLTDQGDSDYVHLVSAVPSAAGAFTGPTANYATAYGGGTYIGAFAVPVKSTSGSAADTTPPVISSFTATAGNAQNTLAWNVTDNVGVDHVTVTRGGTQIYSGTATSYTDAGLTNGTTYSYVLTAYDAAGNTSQANASATPAAGSGTPTYQNGPTSAAGAAAAKPGGRLVRSPDNTAWLPETPVNLPARRLTAWMHGPNIFSRCKHLSGAVTTTTQLNCRRYRKSLFDGQDLVFHDSNIHGVESVTNHGPITVSKVIEITGGSSPTASQAGSSFYRVTWNGQPTVTMAAGAFVKSDPLPIRVVKGQVYYEQNYVVTASGNAIPLQSTVADTSVNELSDSVTTSDQTGTGNMASNSGIGVYGSNAVAATPLRRANLPMVVGIGDSRMEGVSRSNLTSWVDQVLELASIPYLKTSMSGEQSIQFVGAANSPGLYRRVRGRLLSGATDIISDYSINDISSGADGPTMIARMLNGAALAGAYGARFHQTTLEPYTTSTDSWVTADNQTPISTARETARVAANAWLRDGAPYNPTTGTAQPVGTANSATCIRVGVYGHPIVGVIDVAAAVEVTNTAGSLVWNINAMTTDGLHAGDSGHNMIAKTFATYAATRFAAYAA